MPRSPAPQWNTRKQPIVDDEIMRSIQMADGKHHPDTGHYATLYYTGCETEERALEIKQAFHRCAYYMFDHKIAHIGIKTKVMQAADGTYKVEFTAIHKDYTYKYMIDRYGEDKNRWPYNPRSKGKK